MKQKKMANDTKCKTSMKKKESPKVLLAGKKMQEWKMKYRQTSVKAISIKGVFDLTQIIICNHVLP